MAIEATRTGPPRATDPRVAKAAKIAKWLDKGKVDPILGFLVPGLGDLATAAMGLYIVSIAASLKVSVVVIARMVMNIGIDTLIGVIPFVGDIFDFFYAANDRNMKLLVERHENKKASTSDWLFVGASALCLAAAIALPIYLLYRFLAWMF